MSKCKKANYEQIEESKALKSKGFCIDGIDIHILDSITNEWGYSFMFSKTPKGVSIANPPFRRGVYYKEKKYFNFAELLFFCRLNRIYLSQTDLICQTERLNYTPYTTKGGKYA